MLELLAQMNPWWEEGAVPAQMLGRMRPEYIGQMEKCLKRLNTLIITGPRRTGKTTLMRQLIQKHIDSGVSPRHILYLQMDHPSLPEEKLVIESLKALRTAFSLSRSAKVYLFLDEAQYAREWGLQVKVLGENENIEIVVSGSNAAVLEPQAISFLVGRQNKMRVWPLSFKEFLDFRQKDVPLSEQYLYPALFREYLGIGGFPKAVLEEDIHMRAQYLLDIFEDVVYKDIVQVHRIKDINALKDLAFLLASGVGTPASVNKLSKLTRLSLETTREYLGHLQSSYLFHSVGFYSLSVNERTYNPKKYYLVDTGMGASVTARERPGSAAENAVFGYLWRMGSDIYYWKDRFEMDFFVPKRKLAIECKYSDSIDDRDLKGMVLFLEKYRMKSGVVATDTLEEERVIGGKKLRLIPMWKLLLEKKG